MTWEEQHGKAYRRRYWKAHRKNSLCLIAPARVAEARIDGDVHEL